ncbi:translation initiation factor 2A [Nematocida sp. LUAm3]|nr:translation initiation factor 2A [Nematocida sp. LUAm3]KAI5176756.1 translation initiation factor 2A [Nematocida sp. LUAm1]
MEAPEKVLAVTDKGILFNVFNEKEEEKEYVAYAADRRVVAYSTPQQLNIYTVNNERIEGIPIPEIKRIEISPDSQWISAYTQSKGIFLCTHKEIVHSDELVHASAISDEYLVYAREVPNTHVNTHTNTPIAIVDSGKPVVDSEKPVADSVKPVIDSGKPAAVTRIEKKQGACDVQVKKTTPKELMAYSAEKREAFSLGIRSPLSFCVVGKYLVTVRVFTGRGGELEIINLQEKKSNIKIKVPDLLSASFISDKSLNTHRVFAICTVHSSKVSYYDTKVLYYIDSSIDLIKMVPVEGPILDAIFLKNDEFSVCYGNTPSKISFFNGNLKKLSDCKREGIRNRLFFNQQENILCLAGLNNLPGNMELIEVLSNEFLSMNEVLGSSVIDWDPTGRFYLVGVTNKMSIDNKLLIFDYYSRKVLEKPFKELIDCKFLGEKKEFIPLKNPPKKIKIEKKQAYVPPSMRTKQKQEKEYVPAYVIGKKDKNEEKLLTLQKSLEEILEIEEKLNKGEVVPGGMNKLQKKDILLKKISQMKKI